jgi:RNA polymerase-binding transcription factor DksA
MRRFPETRSAMLARKTLHARREQIGTLSARLRRGEDELQGRRPDPLDRAVDLEPRDVFEALQAAERDDLAEIDAALKRISLGTWGSCENCGTSIGELRLRAIPQARRCMGCAAIR